jgi:hypothetical protein
MHNEAHITDRERGMVLRVLISRLQRQGGQGGVADRPLRRIVRLAGASIKTTTGEGARESRIARPALRLPW